MFVKSDDFSVLRGVTLGPLKPGPPTSEVISLALKKIIVYLYPKNRLSEFERKWRALKQVLR